MDANYHQLKLILYSIAFFLFVPLLGNSQLVMSTEESITNTESYVRVFVDDSHFYSFEQLSLPESDSLFLVTKDGHLNFGYTNSSVWCKLININNLSGKQWHLKFNNPLLDILDIYLVDSKGKLVKEVHSGALLGSQSFEHKGNGFLFNLPLEKGEEYDLYFRLEGKNILIPILELVTLEYFFNGELVAIFFNGTFYGILVGLIFYSIILFFYKKSACALFCGLFIFFIGLLDAFLNGYFEYLVPFLSPKYLNESIIFVLGFGYLNLLAFHYCFFKPVIHLKVERILIFSSGIGILVLFGSFWFLDFNFLVVSSWFITFMFPVLICSIVSVKSLLRGYRPARFIVLGFGVLLVGLLFYLLTVSGLIDYKSYKLFGTHSALALEALFFVLALNDRENWSSTSKMASRIEVLKQVKENQQLQTELTKQQIKLYKSVLEAQEKERARIAKDLHDGIGQTLAAVKMIFGQLMYSVPELDSNPAAKSSLDLVDNACTEIRQISHQMMPINLIKFGLKAGLEELLEKSFRGNKIKLEYQITLLNERFPEYIELGVYRIVQEIISNMFKHSKCSNAYLDIIESSNQLIMIVEDDGIGFDLDKNKSSGAGMENIKFRCHAMLGTLVIETKPGDGCVYRINIPLSKN